MHIQLSQPPGGKVFFFPWNGLGTIVESQLTLDTQAYICTVNYTLLTDLFVLRWMAPFCHYSLVVSFKIRSVQVLPSQLTLTILDLYMVRILLPVA